MYAVRLDNVVDLGGYALKEAWNPTTVWAFKDPAAQIKSADPVTYDDSGNVIPLSERFDEKNDDIRYSTKKKAHKIPSIQQSALVDALSSREARTVHM